MKPISGVYPAPFYTQTDSRDYAAAIRDAVTMEDVLSVYCPTLPRHGRRCPCPIHNGRDYNFSYDAHRYKCFVCGESGDVISFAKAVLGLPFMMDAMRRIDADFRLNLFADSSMDAETTARVRRHRAEAEERQRENEKQIAEYHRLLDKWIALDTIRRTADPMSDEYADAVKNIDFIGFMLDSLPLCPQRSSAMELGKRTAAMEKNITGRGDKVFRGPDDFKPTKADQLAAKTQC